MTIRTASGLSQCTVVVTPRSFGQDDPRLRDNLEARVGRVVYAPGPLAAGALSEVIGDADGLIAGLDEISADVLDAAPRLKVVARYGVGTDRVDLAACHRRGVTVTVTPGANANAVAELAVALLFVLARPVLSAQVAARSPRWSPLRGSELRGRTLGLVGLGHIGSLVAVKAAGLGMRVLASDPFVMTSSEAELVELAELLPSADFVSLHAPLMRSTRGLMSRHEFELMKPGSFLVNTARGALIDEAALLWALEEGPVRAAALDVLNEEPPSPGSIESKLLERDDVIVTPHMGPHTAEATSAMGWAAVEEVLAVLSGREPRSPVKPFDPTP